MNYSHGPATCFLHITQWLWLNNSLSLSLKSLRKKKDPLLKLNQNLLGLGTLCWGHGDNIISGPIKQESPTFLKSELDLG